MRNSMIFVILLTLLAVVATPAASATKDEEIQAVKETIVKAYVQGIHIDSDIPAIWSGFHESFTMTMKRDGEIREMSIADWVAAIEKRKKKDPSPPKHKTDWKIPLVDISGDAAVARVEIYRDGKHIYSDYMSLYRFDSGWKIVAKIYYDHRQD